MRYRYSELREGSSLDPQHGRARDWHDRYAVLPAHVFMSTATHPWGHSRHYVSEDGSWNAMHYLTGGGFDMLEEHDPPLTIRRAHWSL